MTLIYNSLNSFGWKILFIVESDDVFMILIDFFVDDSSPCHYFCYFCFRIFAVIAQLVEHWLPKPRVTGSSPAYRSEKMMAYKPSFFVML